MAVQALRTYTEEEYLELERNAEFKSEFSNGRIIAMSGCTEDHDIITGNIQVDLALQLRGKNCRVHTSNMRVRIPETGLFTYPDITVLCGTSQFYGTRKDNLINPTVVVEVLSPSTEAYDRGEKARQYRTLESLQEYILVSQTSAHIDKYVRHQNGLWLLEDADGLNGSIRLESIDCTLRLADVYDRVEFGEIVYRNGDQLKQP